MLSDEVGMQISSIPFVSKTRTITSSREIGYGVKRGLDLVIALLVLIVMAPLMGIVAALICLDSPGSCLFIQKRVGTRRVVRDGQESWETMEFPFFKFRTMVTNADPSIHKAYVKALIENDEAEMELIQGGDNHIKKLTRDPRVTRVGRYLRKYSLDELPQFWNVLRGEMSLVGPRPALPYEVELYPAWYWKRFQARPGITGLQQVKARCSANFEDQIKLDVYYAEHQSIWMDLWIMLRTPFAILKSDGAY